MVQMIGDSNSSRGKILSLLHKVQPGCESHSMAIRDSMLGLRLTTHLLLEPGLPFFLHVFMACIGRTYLCRLRFLFINLTVIWVSLLTFQFETEF